MKNNANLTAGQKLGKLEPSRLLNAKLLFTLMTFLTVYILIQINFERLFQRINSKSTIDFITTNFWPPNTDDRVIQSIEFALIETLQMAVVSTYFGMMMSFPLSLMAARNLSPKYISVPTRLFLAIIRTIPSLVWALLAVILFGLGPRSGIIALSIYTTAYLGKFQYETFEGLSSDSFEALKAVGASRLQLIRYVVFPETANQLISQIVFMLEYNVRAGSIVGFVGAGGVGFLLKFYLGYFHFGAIVTTILYLLVTVVAIDFIGGKIRQKYQDPNFDELNI